MSGPPRRPRTPEPPGGGGRPGAPTDVDARLVEVDRRLAELRASLATFERERQHLLSLRARQAPAPVGRRPVPITPLPPPPAGGGWSPPGGPPAPAAWGPPPPPPGRRPPPPPAGDGARGAPARRPRREVRPVTLRNVLLGLGVTLLVLAAIVFAAVAWPRLDDAGRATVLGLVTLVFAGLSVGLARPLRATAEAFGVLTTGMLLVDWYAVRRAGAGEDLDLLAWWAAGTALVGIATIGLAAATRLDAGRLVGVLLLGGSVALAGGLPDGDPAWLVVATAVLAAAFAAAGAWLVERDGWRPAGGAAALVAAGLGGLSGIWWLRHLDTAGWGPATGAALAAVAVVPAVGAATWRRRLEPGARDLLVGAAGVLVLAALPAALADALSPAWLGVIVAAEAVVAVVVARGVPAPVGTGLLGAARLAGVVAVVPVALPTAQAVLAPWRFLGDPWSVDPGLTAADHLPTRMASGALAVEPLADAGPAALVLVGVVALLTALVVPWGRPVPWMVPAVARPAGALALGLAGLLGLLAAGASIAVVAVGALALAAGLAVAGILLVPDRTAADVLAPALLLAPALGWSLADAWLTVAVVGGLAVAAAVVAALDRSGRSAEAGVAALAAQAAVALAVLAAEGTVAEVAVALALVAAALVGLAVLALRGDDLRSAVGVVAGLGLAVVGLLALPAWLDRPGLATTAVAVVAAAGVLVAVGPRLAAPLRSTGAGGAAVLVQLLAVMAVGLLDGALAQAEVALAVTGLALVLVAVAALRAHPLRPAVGLAALVGAIAVVWLAGPAWSGSPDLVTVAVGVLTAQALVVAVGPALAAGLRAAAAGVAAVLVQVLAVLVADLAGAEGAQLVVVWGATAGAGVAAIAHLVPGARGRAAVGVALAGLGGAELVALAAQVDLGWRPAAVVASTALAALLAGAAARPWRRLAHVAPLAALAAAWTWLAEAEVTVVEAYSLSAAALALAVGITAWWRDRQLSSWWTWAPGLLVAVLPSLVPALLDDVARAVLVSVVAIAAVAAGTAWRLQAPVVLGALALVALGVDAVAPTLAALPRWVLLAAAGAVAIWLGATVERRLRQARHAVDGFRHLH